MKLNFQDGTSTADLVIGADAMYKGKMFEGLPEGYHALEANVKINGDGVSPEEVKDHILEHYRSVELRSNASGTNNAKAYVAQQHPVSGGGKFTNKNGNGGGKRGKNGKFGGGISKQGKGKGKGGQGGLGKNLGKDNSRPEDKCYFCDEKGHWEKDCLK